MQSYNVLECLFLRAVFYLSYIFNSKYVFVTWLVVNNYYFYDIGVLTYSLIYFAHVGQIEFYWIKNQFIP